MPEAARPRAKATATARGSRAKAGTRAAPRPEPTAAERAAAALPHPPPPREQTLPPAGAGPSAPEDPPGPLNGMPWQPVRMSSRPAGDTAAARITLFYIDDRPYSIPAEPGPSVGLEFMHAVARLASDDSVLGPALTGAPPKAGPGDGPGAAASQALGMVSDAVAIDGLMTSLLGEGGWAALRGCKGMQSRDFAKIVEIALRVAMGAVELPKGPASA